MAGEVLFSAAAERNAEPLAKVLRPILAAGDHVLEIASGTGQHAAYFSAQFRDVGWHPSDCDPDYLESIRAHKEAGERFAAPLVIDVTEPGWASGLAGFNGIFCANMIHISPSATTLGLIEGASHLLQNGGKLMLYGPFKRDSRHTAPSNEAFDESLRAQDPDWGVRDLEDVAEIAAGRGFAGPTITQMPANNLFVLFERA